LLRHCVNALTAAAMLCILAACSSGPSVREANAPESIPESADGQVSVSDAEFENGSGLPEETELESTVDLSIEANFDEISEKTQRTYDTALEAMRSENWLQAELELQSLIEDEPGFPGPYVNLALIYEQDGRRREARQALEQALAIAPGFPPANNELGRMLREEGDFSGAELAYGRALATDPFNAVAHLNLGILLDVYLRRPADALEHYNQYQATRTEPDETVSRWIVDLERRAAAAERVARD
jgi:tetratricopeptide (TPR) repeat protein